MIGQLIANVTRATTLFFRLAGVVRHERVSRPGHHRLPHPGQWAKPGELIERLPDGHRPTGDALALPDGTEIEFGAAAANDQFAAIFGSSC